ncbi:hypothetical protein [Nocardia niwae]|nr:hypothetical protein [Nocardia niwae]
MTSRQWCSCTGRCSARNALLGAARKFLLEGRSVEDSGEARAWR